MGEPNEERREQEESEWCEGGDTGCRTTGVPEMAMAVSIEGGRNNSAQSKTILPVKDRQLEVASRTPLAGNLQRCNDYRTRRRRLLSKDSGVSEVGNELAYSQRPRQQLQYAARGTPLRGRDP